MQLGRAAVIRLDYFVLLISGGFLFYRNFNKIAIIKCSLATEILSIILNDKRALPFLLLNYSSKINIPD